MKLTKLIKALQLITRIADLKNSQDNLQKIAKDPEADIYKFLNEIHYIKILAASIETDIQNLIDEKIGISDTIELFNQKNETNV